MSDFARTVSLSDIQTASSFLRQRVKQTPLVENQGVTARANCDAFGASLFLKMENQQRTGSFKIPGRDLENRFAYRISENAGSGFRIGGQSWAGSGTRCT